MSYSFRLHFLLGERARISHAGIELPVWTDGTREVSIKSAGNDGDPLAETVDMILRGSGWDTEDEARQEGERLKVGLDVWSGAPRHRRRPPPARTPGSHFWLL